MYDLFNFFFRKLKPNQPMSRPLQRNKNKSLATFEYYMQFLMGFPLFFSQSLYINSETMLRKKQRGKVFS